MKSEIVIVDGNFPDAVDEVEGASHHDVAVRRNIVSDPTEIPGVVGDAAGMLVQFMPISDETMAKLPNVKVIGRYGVGVDNIDLDAATKRGIKVVYVPDYCVDEVATHAVAMALATWRNLSGADTLVRTGRWASWQDITPIPPLNTARVGLIGVGRIGRRVAQMLDPMVDEIVAYDPHDASPGIRSVQLDELLATSDIVSIHCPLTDTTSNLINSSTIAQMQPHAVLVNVSRGGIVNSDDVAAAVESQQLRGAALDVLVHEPPALDDPVLQSTTNLNLSPHIAWYSDTSISRLRQSVARRTAAALVGADPETLAN